MSLYAELKRRNVIRVATAYLAAAWLLVEVAGTLFPIYGLSDAAVRIVVTLLAIGFPITLVLSWVYEITPEGLKLEKDIDRTHPAPRDSTKRLDRVIIVLLALALGYFAFDKFVFEPARDAELVEETTQKVRTDVLVESYGDKSIAVLPFVNMSSDPEQEYFSDGISEELLNVLAKVPDLRVISRSSAFSFKGKDIAIPEVAEQLNVEHVLEGSVRKAGNRVRITAQLIEARSDTHIWSETFDRELDDIFAVQDEITAVIVDMLKVELALVGGETVRPTVIEAANSAAYDAYLRGRELIRLRGPQNLRDAVQHLERSLRLDDYFAPARAQLAIATLLMADIHLISPGAAKQIATTQLDRADELEPNLADAYAARALLANSDDDFESAIKHARRALELNPSHVNAMNWLRGSLWTLGRYQESVEILEKMQLVDPLSVTGRINYVGRLSYTGRFEEAHQLADQLLGENPDLGYFQHSVVSYEEGKLAESLYWALRRWDGVSPVIPFMLVGEFAEARRVSNEVMVYFVDLFEGKYEETLRAAREGMLGPPDSFYAIWIQALVLYYSGRIDEALPFYERLLELVPEGRPIPSEFGHADTLHLALARRKVGDEQGANDALQIVKQDHAALRAIGSISHMEDVAESMIAALEHHPDKAVTALKSAMQRGLRDKSYFVDPVFEEIWDEPRFVALQQEMDAILAVEHARILQLVCFNNPVPGDWQPLPETCEGVVEE